jgi:hypothetical protein
MTIMKWNLHHEASMLIYQAFEVKATEETLTQYYMTK